MADRSVRLARVGIAVACLATTFALYFRALALGFVSDDIGFVWPDPQWLATAWRPSGEWHYYPLNIMVFQILARLSGWNAGLLHLVNLVLHAALGVGLSMWLERFGLRPWARALAAVFFVSRGVSYEVVVWITELSYLSVAAYTLLTLVAWDRYLRRGGRGNLAATVLGFSAALFTIEHALVMVPLFALHDLLLAPRGHEAGSGRWTRWRSRMIVRDAVKYLPFVVVVAVFLFLKRSHDVSLLWSGATAATAPPPLPSGMDLTTQLPADRVWHGFLNAPLRALLDLLLGTGFLVLPTGVASGAETSWLTRHVALAVVPWLAVQVAIVWKGGPLGRLLLAWIYLYLAPLAIAGVPQARYYYMATIPAAALIGVGLDAAIRRLGSPGAIRAAWGVATLLVVLVIAGEADFIRRRLDEWSVASHAVRAAIDRLDQDVRADATDVYWVDLPRAKVGPFWPAYAFANAGEHLHMMLRPPHPGIRPHVVYDRSFTGDAWPTIGTYLPREEAVRRAAEPGALGYEFVDRPPWVLPIR